MRCWRYIAVAGLLGSLGLGAPLLSMAQAPDMTNAQPPGRWSTGPGLPVKRGDVGVAALNGEIFVIGGTAQGLPDQPLVQAFDPESGDWETRAPLPKGLSRVGLVSFNGRLYAFGGFTRNTRGAVDQGWVYDPASDQWAPIAPLPNQRGAVAVAVLDGKIHAIGGEISGRDPAGAIEHDVYDPALDRWTAAAPLPAGDGRDHLGLLSHDGKLYAIGGRFGDINHDSNLAESYDPATDQWSELPRMPTARGGGAAAVYHDRLLYIGGERGGDSFTENEAFDPASGNWTEMTPMPRGRQGTGAAVIGNTLYVPGGSPTNGGGQSDTLFAFDLP